VVEPRLDAVREFPRFGLFLPYAAFEAGRVRTWLVLADLDCARSWVHSYKPGSAATPVNREIVLIALARVRLASGAPADFVRTFVEVCERVAEVIVRAPFSMK
jgi:hypothetical protein